MASKSQSLTIKHSTVTFLMYIQTVLKLAAFAQGTMSQNHNHTHPPWKGQHKIARAKRQDMAETCP